MEINARKQHQRILQIEASPDIEAIRQEERRKAEAEAAVQEEQQRLREEIAEKDALVKRARRTTIAQLFTKDRTSVRGYVYARKAPRGYAILAVKLGRTNDRFRRAMQQNNPLPVKEKYLKICPIENADELTQQKRASTLTSHSHGRC